MPGYVNRNRSMVPRGARARNRPFRRARRVVGMPSMFDTLAVAQQLAAGGVDRNQAGGHRQGDP